VLLVLDNCAHVTEGCAALIRTLRSCSGVRLLCTSTVPLQVPGEVVYRIPPLSIPPEGVAEDASLQGDAVRLFGERARLHDSSCELDQTNALQVAEICRSLSGHA